VIYALYGLLAFVGGSIPFGVIVSWLRGVDLRKIGSGNVGATNAARALGKPLGMLVLVLDAMKAFAPIVIVRSQLGGRADLDWILAAMAYGAFLGHIYSPWLKFKGGKGVATGLGVFLALAPEAAAVAAIVWVVLYVLTRTSSIGSLLAVIAMVVTVWLGHRPRVYLWLSLAMAVLIFWRHRGNIARILRREESKV